MARKRLADEAISAAAKAMEQRSENSKVSRSRPDREERKWQRCIISKRSRLNESQFTPIGELNKLRSTYGSVVSPRTQTPEIVRRKRKKYYAKFGLDQEGNPVCDTRRSSEGCSRIFPPDEEESMRIKLKRSSGFGFEHETATTTHGADRKKRRTEDSEPRVCTPVSEILGKNSHCESHILPPTAKPSSRSQRQLFCGPRDHDKGQRHGGGDGDVHEEEKRGWAVDRRRKDLDHGKFSEDEIISLNCGLAQLMQARKWGRDEAVRTLTHSGGRGRPHAQARGTWKEIAKNLPNSSIVRVNMKARTLLFKGKTGRWDADETELLKRLVQEHENDWITIASKLDRSNGACARKWRTLRLDEIRPRTKGKWTANEYDELCHLVREAKAARILTFTRKAGNRKVKDNLRWEPIAFKMGRSASQCGAVWYDRLAPSMDKELCLAQEDRKWADEDDRRLLKKMLRLMSRHGEISLPKVFLRNRKAATCKARFNQMTRPICLRDQSDATIEEKLRILVKRYAPDLLVKFNDMKRDDKCKHEIGAGESEARVQARHGEVRPQETGESINKSKFTTDPTRSNYSFTTEERAEMPMSHEHEHEESMNWATSEEGESNVRRDSGNNGFRHAEPSESSCFRDEGSVGLACQSEGRREGWSRNSPEKEDESESYYNEDDGMEEGSTSERYVHERIDQRHHSEPFMKRIGHKIWKTDIKMYRNHSAKDSIEQQNGYRDRKGRAAAARRESSVSVVRRVDSEGRGGVCQLLEEEEVGKMREV